MSEEKVAFQSDGFKLDGLLTRPAGAGPCAASVLLPWVGECERWLRRNRFME